ncbi:MAG: acyl-ACP--UDP-N-acetylglucosamine O-acyltransferase [Elusimicrobia bacterium]|jgi:UDP-N-acetylglucosamine acyltransferase|nr:acyl-ACP--UDP-N-acetylglucosamine O-acyltransferase [Elusimicrobiota bacterium]
MIDKRAIIGDNVEIAEGVSVGPYAVIRDNVSIGKNTKIDARVLIEGNTAIGEDNYIGIGTIIGNPPQDLKYNGEPTKVLIGNGNTIREYVTINRGTVHSGVTKIGNKNMLMSYVHIAHDCIIEDKTVIANCATLAGHVTVETGVIIGGLTPIHQFTRLGRFSIIGGCSRVTKDVTPYCKVAGNPVKMYGLNSVGLKRNNFTEKERKDLKDTYRIIFRKKTPTKKAVSKIKSGKLIKSEHVNYMMNFIENSKRGIIK